MMKLIGAYDSPFVRRVAVTMNLYGMPFKHVPLSTVADLPAVEAVSPLGRIPALVLDDGEALVDSSAIIDFLDERAGAAKALTPAGGERRRRVNAIIAIALGVADKYVAAYYETHKRPESHVWKPWLDRLEQQARQVLDALEARCAGPWMTGGEMTQADVTTVAVIDTIRFDMGHLAPVGAHPKLDDLVRRAMARQAFATTAPG